MLQPGLLKKVVPSRLVKDDLVANRSFERWKFSRVINPFHLPLEPALDRTEPFHDSVLNVLDPREHFTILHFESLRVEIGIRSRTFPRFDSRLTKESLFQRGGRLAAVQAESHDENRRNQYRPDEWVQSQKQVFAEAIIDAVPYKIQEEHH